MAAFSLIELLFVLGVAATLTSVAVPQLSSSLNEVHSAGAARHIAARLQQARVRALSRSRATALRIRADGRGYLVTEFEDGNRNGVLAADIASGTDVPVGPPERLPELYSGVDFGALPGIPGAEGSTAPGSDPIRLGAADSVTFTPFGTATPGSLYLRGRTSTQYVVRIYGETGRTRIMRYSPATRSWWSR
ncbi:MAG: GspH/FimT family pseudopilin [Vicinamibacterales bacterium]